MQVALWDGMVNRVDSIDVKHTLIQGPLCKLYPCIVLYVWCLSVAVL